MRRLLIIPAALVALLSFSADAEVGRRFDVEPARCVPGELIVKMKPGASAFEINTSAASTGIKGVYLIRINERADIDAAAAEIESDPNVEYAIPNYVRRTLSPDDPKYLDVTQWGLYRITLNHLGSAESGWNETTGTDEVVIAVVDTGVDWDHPDLAANIWINSAESIGSPGVDDDLNGFVDDIRGWDFVSVPTSDVWSGEDPGPPDNDPMDFDGHGTHVSGIASSATDNAAGIAGTGWNCRIMALRAGFKGNDGWGYLTDLDASEALIYAADNGADVINMSWGDFAYSPLISEAVGYAYAKGSILVAAAGNLNSATPLYPAASEKVLSVGATDKNDVRSIWGWAGSSYGDWVEVYAPGGSGVTDDNNWIFSTMFDDTYGYKAGTSMASPFVAGIAGLMRTKYPSWSLEDIREQIRNSAINKSYTYYTGYEKVKRADAYRALIYPQADISSPSYLAQVGPGNDVDIVGTAKDLIGSDYADYLVEASHHPYTAWTTIVATNEQVDDGILGTWTVPNELGLWRIRMKVQDAAGHTSEAFTTVTVLLPGTTRIINSIYAPNPFNPKKESIKIRFTLSRPASNLELKIYDISGKQVYARRYYYLDAGEHELSWDGRSDFGGIAANGVYPFQIIIGSDTETRGKIILFQ